MSKPLVIIGNGGHASVLTEILIAENATIIGYTAPSKEHNQFGLSYLGTDDILADYSPFDVDLVLGVGMLTPKSFREVFYLKAKKNGYTFKKVIHPSAIISPSVIIGEGTQIMAGSIVQTATKIADNTIINTGTIIDHDCIIGSHVHISPGSKISGNVQIKNSTQIGTGSTIIQGIEIGESCLIGAGAVVVKDIANNIKSFGVPAKEVKKYE